MIPETQYATSGEVDLAYQILGDGSRDIVMCMPGASHLDFMWELPEIALFLERLATLGRLIIFDKRGVGLSDRTTEVMSVEQRAADTITVMDAAESRQAVLIGSSDAGATALVIAALYPERVTSVIANDVIATSASDKTHPWGWNPLILQSLPFILKAGWGKAISIRGLAPAIAKDKRQLEWWKRYESMSATPSAAAKLIRSILNFDIRPYLDQVHVPVLLVHDVNNVLVPTDGIRWLADQLPDARLKLTNDGSDRAALVPGEPMLDEIEEFLTGTRSGGQAGHQVRTLLVTDVVSSTAHLADIGDDNWHRVVAAHRGAVRRSIARQNGQEIDTAGDGFLIAFGLPSAALRCAQEVRREADQMGLPIRAGVHAGEVVLRDRDIFGVAVHITARVAALATSGEVLLTETVRSLVAGARLDIQPAGEHELRGVAGSWQLYRLL